MLASITIEINIRLQKRIGAPQLQNLGIDVREELIIIEEDVFNMVAQDLILINTK